MPWNLLYTIINALVIPAWLLLILAPRWRTTRLVVHSGLYPMVLGSIYALCLIASIFFGQSAEGVGMGDINSVMLLFDHPNGVLVGWTHYLVFDLFVGAWIGRDAARRGIAHLAAAPCQIGAFIFGPVGLLGYMIVRLIKGEGFDLDETSRGEA